MSEPTAATAGVTRPGDPGYAELVAEAERQQLRAQELEKS